MLKPGIDATHLKNVVEEHGVRKLAVVRLYISQMYKIGGVDPSISLHDVWQTTSIIASGYATRTKKVHLFELSVPAVESLGWTMMEVANAAEEVLGPSTTDNLEDWFNFQAPACDNDGVWFNARLQRTERFGLYGVPSLRDRLRNLYVFDSNQEIRGAVRPFVVFMSEQHRAQQHI